MKLYELDARRRKEQVAKVFESHLGTRADFSRLSLPKARHMLSRVREVIGEHRNCVSFHFSERNPDYLRLMMMEQALEDHISEMDAGGVVAVDVKDPKTQATLKKAQAGQNLTPDEQKIVTAIASMKKESRRAKRMVSESEVQQAQVVLAAQDMVDRVQKMMEQISEMQFKDLPALADSIKNDMGVEQSQQFQAAASAALGTLLTSVQAGKQELEAAQGVLTGQAPVVPGMEEPVAEPGAEAGDELGADLELDANLDDEEDEIAADLGRERR
jgi:hypothetical protein